MLDHGPDEVISGKIGVRKSEILVLLLPLPDQVPRFHVQHLEDPVELICGRGVLEILNDLELDAVFTQQADRLPGFASLGVVPESEWHG